MKKNKAAQQLGRLGGKAKSEAKSTAARQNGRKGGRKGMYSVIQVGEMGEQSVLQGGISKVQAGAVAQSLADKGEDGIFVTFFRKTDGQHGYLNQDSGCAIDGKMWEAQ